MRFQPIPPFISIGDIQRFGYFHSSYLSLCTLRKK
jgi:hypothetical protein